MTNIKMNTLITDRGQLTYYRINQGQSYSQQRKGVLIAGDNKLRIMRVDLYNDGQNIKENGLCIKELAVNGYHIDGQEITARHIWNISSFAHKWNKNTISLEKFRKKYPAYHKIKCTLYNEIKDEYIKGYFYNDRSTFKFVYDINGVTRYGIYPLTLDFDYYSDVITTCCNNGYRIYFVMSWIYNFNIILGR